MGGLLDWLLGGTHIYGSFYDAEPRLEAYFQQRDRVILYDQWGQTPEVKTQAPFKYK